MYDVLILGGGPAGLTAGIYAARSNLKVLIIEKGMPGGQMQNTLGIENYPGIKSISGAELSDKMHQQVLEVGAEFVVGNVTKVELEGELKKVYVGDTEYTGKTVILATGAHPRYLDVPGEKEFAGMGVSYCATCDGAFYRNRDIVVVGGGDSAVEESVYLTQFAKTVKIVHRRDTLNAQPILQERAFKNEKIEFIWNSEVVEILGDKVVTGVKIRNRETNEITELPVQGVFIYIGFIPNTTYLKETNLLNEWGYLITDNRMRTTIPGVFGAGDMRDTPLRQIITAASDGAIAAISAYNYIQDQK
ncbi:MAG: thioredoxin-disulfide reductase [Firmicutes bacterium]|nr:thioredoxin-disulfide reductase [Bacillota bacterium]